MQEEFKRKIRSFVRREGRLTVGQQRALEELYPQYGLPAGPDTVYDFAAIYGNTHDVHLEIGFGTGQALTYMASAHPENNYIGIEVHRPGVGNALLQIEKQGLSNARVVCHDAVEVLQHNIPDGSLAAVYIFFPDPWHKKRHHKRRLIQAELVERLRHKLKPDGLLHMATDWQHYAEHILAVMKTQEGYRNLSADGTYCERPDTRPLTRFEQRGLRLGHGVWDLLFRKTTG